MPRKRIKWTLDPTEGTRLSAVRDYVLTERTVMLVSRSCDVDKLMRKQLLVAPVVAVDNLADAQKTAQKLGVLATTKFSIGFIYLKMVIFPSHTQT